MKMFQLPTQELPKSQPVVKKKNSDEFVDFLEEMNLSDSVGKCDEILNELVKRIDYGEDLGIYYTKVANHINKLVGFRRHYNKYPHHGSDSDEFKIKIRSKDELNQK